MNKIIELVFTTLVGIAVLLTIASADVNKGKKIYMKELKATCGFNGAKFARAHTQDEWESIKEAGKFGLEVQNICPKSKLKSKYENDIYDFSYEYAKDSGNVPSC